MQHLYDNPRDPLDGFEQTLINAFSKLRSVEAIWVREVPLPSGKKRFLRSIWLQLWRKSESDLHQIQALINELGVRTLNKDYTFELHWLVNDLPPAAIAPSCIWRRDLLKIV